MSRRATTTTIFDPFHGKRVEISDDLVDRLRGRYSNGPTMPNGEPEFGWHQYPQVPIQLDAADRIEQLEGALAAMAEILSLADPAFSGIDRYEGAEGIHEVVVRLQGSERAAELARMLGLVRSGEGASLGPEPKPRIPPVIHPPGNA